MTLLTRLDICFIFLSDTKHFYFLFESKDEECVNVINCFIHINSMLMYGHFEFIFGFCLYSQLTCYFVFEVTDMSEKILLQLFPNCSANDELSVNNGKTKYVNIS